MMPKLLTCLYVYGVLVALTAGQDSIFVLANISSDATLICPLNPGSGDQINWLNNKMMLNASNKYMFGGSTGGSNSNLSVVTDYSVLTIDNVMSQDAGRYMCQLKSSGASYQDFSLFLFDPVKVTLNTTQMINVGDPIAINCSVTTYSETNIILPNEKSLSFMIVVNNQQLYSQQIPIAESTRTRYRSIVYNTTASNDMVLNNITCILQTQDKSYTQIGYGRASLPYPPASNLIQLTNVQPIYHVNDLVNCSVPSNPLSTVTWVMNTSQPGCGNSPGMGPNGPGYSILKISCIGPQKWTCMSQYQVSSSSPVVVVNNTFSFDVRDTNNDTFVPPVGADANENKVDRVGIGVGIGIGLGVPLLIGLILLICCLGKRKRGNKSELKDPNKKPVPTQQQQKQTQVKSQQPFPNSQAKGGVSLKPNPAYHGPILNQQLNPNNQTVVMGAPGYPDIGVKHIGGSGSIPQLNDSSFDNQAYLSTGPNHNVKVDFGKAALGGVTNI